MEEPESDRDTLGLIAILRSPTAQITFPSGWHSHCYGVFVFEAMNNSPISFHVLL